MQVPSLPEGILVWNPVHGSWRCHFSRLVRRRLRIPYRYVI